MKRDPKEVIKQKYFKNIRIKKFRPMFLWYSCECCGQQFRREPMFECSELSIAFTRSHHYRGCLNCFKNEEEFRQWLIDNGYLLSEDDFEKLTPEKLWNH